jgi:hypothetical protein
MGKGKVRIYTRFSVSATRSVVILPPTVPRNLATIVRNRVTLSKNIPLGLRIVKLPLIRL